MSTSQRVRPSATARSTAHTAATMSSTSSASGLLNLNISTATGVSASTAPASSPAAAPNCRLTVTASSHTDATPMRASGARMLHELSPKIRTDRATGHNEAGGLSTVMLLAASELPKNNAFQLCEPACAAAE